MEYEAILEAWGIIARLRDRMTLLRDPVAFRALFGAEMYLKQRYMETVTEIGRKRAASGYV